MFAVLQQKINLGFDKISLPQLAVEHYKNGIVFMIGFLLFTISASIIIAWLLQNSEYNLIISVLFHLSINLGFLIFFKDTLTDSKLMLMNGIIWLIPAAIIVATSGKNLSSNWI